MRPFFSRALQGAGAAGLAVVLSSTPASAGVGTRLANGAGATSGTCMSVTNTGRGTSVEMEPCTTNAHQGWDLEIITGGLFRIVSQDADARGRCLTAHGEGVRVTMDRCSEPGTERENQVWQERPTSSAGWYQYFMWVDVGRLCLDVRDNGNSEVVQLWLCGPTSTPGVKGNQMWKWW